MTATPQAPQTNHATGLAGEHATCDLLKRRGWRIVARRVRTRWGEIDIVARRHRTIAFVEVKTTRSSAPVDEVAGRIRGAARRRIRHAAVSWIATHHDEIRGVTCFRFDVALVRLSRFGDRSRVDYVPNAW